MLYFLQTPPYIEWNKFLKNYVNERRKIHIYV